MVDLELESWHLLSIGKKKEDKGLDLIVTYDSVKAHNMFVIMLDVRSHMAFCEQWICHSNYDKI